MTHDHKLLQEYATTRSQTAFAELAQRYTDLVYTSAHRQLGGDAHLAEDVTQAVFIVLAERARSVPHDRPMSAWLLKVTGYCAANARRQRARRGKHEQKAADMGRTSTVDGQSQWNDLAPLLDQGISKLASADRDALLLRYFEKMSLREVGDTLGVSEEAAQKRVTRAVEKLRDFFRRRGVTTACAAGVAALLASGSVQAAPAGLAQAMASSAAEASSASLLAKGAMTAMAMKKAALLTAGAVLLAAGVGGGMAGMQRGKSGTTPPAGVTPQAQAASQPATVPAGAVAFSDGTLVHLMALTELPGAPSVGWVGRLVEAVAPAGAAAMQWWAVDGSAVPAVSLTGLGNVSAGPDAGRRQIRLIFAMRGGGGPGAPGSGLAITVDGAGSSAQSSGARDNQRLINHVVSIPQDQARTRVRLGLASGRWREVASKPVGANGAMRATGAAVFGELFERDGSCWVDVDTSRIPQSDWRIEAVLSNGQRVTSNAYRGFGDGKGEAGLACRKDQVVRLVGSSRPYEWKTLTNVALHPAATTRPSTAPSAVTGKVP